jgi:hypothetical protein
MKTRVWIWQFNHDYPGPDGDDSKLPIGEAWVKTHDGRYWMGDIYSHPLAPRSTDGVKNLKRIYEDQGIGFVPWCVPTGRNPNAEAALAISVLRITGKLVLDVEPYNWFWTGPWSNLHPYMQAIRAAVPNAWICLSMDPRYGTYGRYTVDKFVDIHFEEWLPYINAVAPQDYWGDFGVDPVWEIEHSWARLKDTGKEVIFTLPAVTDPNLLRAGLTRAVELGCRQSPYGAVSLWRRGGLTAENIQIIREQGIPEPPVDPCHNLLVDLAMAQHELAEVQARLVTVTVSMNVLRTTAKGSAGELEGCAAALEVEAKMLTDRATLLKAIASTLRQKAQ